MLIAKYIKYIIGTVSQKVFPNIVARRLLNKSKCETVIIYGGYEINSHIKENCEYFLTQEELDNQSYIKKTTLDIVKCYLKYGTNANEYFCYNFPNLKDSKRKLYLPRKRKDELLIRQMGPNWSMYFNELKDKYKFYSLTKNFFLRDACQVVTENDYNDFERIINKHHRIIAKPSLGGCGVGVMILDIRDYDNLPKRVFEYLISFNTPFIVEEIVSQDPSMAEWNESSLNTIRIPSFRTKTGVRIVYPSLRVGRAGCIVDNAGSGGTFAAIDPVTGIIISDGFDKRGQKYQHHPDSQKQYRNSQIPQWDKLIATVEQLHLSLPSVHKYVAFDFALSKDGWILIEGNWGELSMPQIEFSKGLYAEFKKLLNDDE